MESQVNEIDPVTVELSVQVPWERVEKGLNASYGKLQKSARVRGFRPGKVPRNVLRKLYGSQVNNEVVATLIEEGLLAAVEQHDIAVVASPQVDDLPSITKGEPLAFKAKLEVRPTIDSVVTEGLELMKPNTEVPDDQVEAEIERLRQQNAEIVTPEESRPAKEGDLLTIDYTVEIDGEEKPDMAASARVVELGGGRLLPEFEEGLTGKTSEDEVEIRVAYDEETPNPDLQNKRALFKVKITELREKILPELDDEFAKDLGEHETLAALQDATRQKLADAAEERAKSALREQAIEQLVEKNPVPVPPSLTQQQEQSMRQELAFFMQMTGQQMDLGDPAEMTERAEKKVRAAIVMGALARQQEINVEPEEVDAKLQEIANDTGKHIAKVRVEYAGEKRESLENKLLEDKLLEFLLGQATVTDAPPQSETNETEDAPKEAD